MIKRESSQYQREIKDEWEEHSGAVRFDITEFRVLRVIG